MKRTLLLVVLLASCQSSSISTNNSAPPQPESGPPANADKPIQINKDGEILRLQKGAYLGPLQISANNVSVEGAGSSETRVGTGLQISGNKVGVRGITIGGDVSISGDNVELIDVKYFGKVLNSGQGNRY